MMTKPRRTLRQAYKEDSPALESFVFGDRSPSIETSSQEHDEAWGVELVVPIIKVHKTFSFVPDQKPLRYYYDLDQIRDWAEKDLKPNGIRSPLWTRPMPGKPDEYELVAGLRRLTGAELVGFTDVPIKVFELNDIQAYEAAFDENDRRQDFSKLEEVDNVLNLLAQKLDMERENLVSLLYRMDNAAKGKVTQSTLGSQEAQVIEEFFQSREQLTWQSFVSTRLPLLKKPPEILEAVRTSRLDYTKALEIARVNDPAARSGLLEVAIKQQMSLANVKERVKALKTPSAPPTQTDLKSRFKATFRQMNQAKIWTNSEKAAEIESLLVQLEHLLG